MAAPHRPDGPSATSTTSITSASSSATPSKLWRPPARSSPFGPVLSLPRARQASQSPPTTALTAHPLIPGSLTQSRRRSRSVSRTTGVNIRVEETRSSIGSGSDRIARLSLGSSMPQAMDGSSSADNNHNAFVERVNSNTSLGIYRRNNPPARRDSTREWHDAIVVRARRETSDSAGRAGIHRHSDPLPGSDIRPASTTFSQNQTDRTPCSPSSRAPTIPLSTTKAVLPAMETMLGDMEKELTCSICTSIYLNPVSLLDCLHSYCGACAKEWFVPPPATSISSASSTVRGCPTCRQAVRAIKPSAHLNSLVTIFLRANPHLQRDQQEIAELEALYRPGDTINVQRDLSSRESRERRDRTHDTGRRAGEGWWDGLMEIDPNQNIEDDAFQLAMRDSLIESHFSSLNQASTVRYPTFDPTVYAPLQTVSSNEGLYGTRAADWFPQMQNSTSASTAASGVQNVQNVTSNASRVTLGVHCDRCNKRAIHYGWHYHCYTCQGGDYDLCFDCHRQGNRCLASPEQPHELEPRKFRALDDVLQRSYFCNVDGCETACNNLFYRCKQCNNGWDYCPSCVNKGNCCSHDLEAMSCIWSVISEFGISSSNRRSLTDIMSQRATFRNQNIVRGEARPARPASTPSPLAAPQPLKLWTKCNICILPIDANVPYYHCTQCGDSDWDAHTQCHSATSNYNQIPCPHKKQLAVQYPFPDSENPTTFFRRILRPPQREWEERSYTYNTSSGTTITLEPLGGRDARGQRATAKWAYWPEKTRYGTADELGFPRGAVIEDVIVVNREWMWGWYGLKQGLFPGGWVTLLADEVEVWRTNEFEEL